MKKFVRNFVFNNIHRHWNIAIATLGEDLLPYDIKWLQHHYEDRWFADPFIIEETDDTFVILVEEYMRDDKKARLAQLTASKCDCQLLDNQTILSLDSHLSFPNFLDVDGKTYIYPENGRAGNTKYYERNKPLKLIGEFSHLPLADAVIQKINRKYYLFYTLGIECNGNRLFVESSDSPFGPYEAHQEILFSDNVARRAGRMFKCGDKLISPAQICNNRYGEGVCIQEVVLNDDSQLTFNELKRLYPTSKEYPSGFHTFNVFGNHVVIDGYRFKYPFLSKTYFSLRGGQL